MRYDHYTDRFIMGDNSSMLSSQNNLAEEVFEEYYDSLGNFHYFGTKSREHIIKIRKGKQNEIY